MADKNASDVGSGDSTLHSLIPLGAEAVDAEAIFQEIDANHDGRISLQEMKVFIRNHQLPFSEASLEHFYKAMDGDKNGEIELDEFRQYVIEKEVYLQRLFKRIDENDDGHIDRRELKKALMALNLKASEKQIDELMGYVSDLESSTIRYEAWRSFLLMLPTNDIREIFDFWQKATGIDIGENFSVPDETGKNKHPLRLLFAGALAGAVSRTATAPLDRLKILLQVNSAQYSGIRQGMEAIYQQGGLKAFFRGNGTNVLKIAPESAFKFFAYDKFKTLICASSGNPTTLERMFSGSLAGLASQAFVYPLETIKTRLATSPNGMYKGIAHAASSIVKKEGFFFLYRGIVPALIGVIPYAGIDLAVYESLKVELRNHHFVFHFLINDRF
eukprot:TRINITY_DN6110_c0_g1_i2.p1 TRINITY_DN6110_c0_g1~~TRINITY_DN6110_c0_g1_i2.p1  ORF type:complete len:387 (-),score=95.32 TRINITY_DN6110_c0_g1_i2:889-2049(-)